jgi:hypothetical protein
MREKNLRIPKKKELPWIVENSENREKFSLVKFIYFIFFAI